MEEIIHTCSRHGLLRRDEVIKNGSEHTGIRYRCKICKKSTRGKNTKNNSIKYYQNNKNKILEKRADFYGKNTKKIRQQESIRRSENKKHHNALSLKYAKKARVNLLDHYVRSSIRDNTKYSFNKITQNHLCKKRIILLLKTEIRIKKGLGSSDDFLRIETLGLPPEFLEARELEAKGNPEIELKYTQEIADLIEEEYEKLLLTISATPE